MIPASVLRDLPWGARALSPDTDRWLTALRVPEGKSFLPWLVRLADKTTERRSDHWVSLQGWSVDFAGMAQTMWDCAPNFEMSVVPAGVGFMGQQSGGTLYLPQGLPKEIPTNTADRSNRALAFPYFDLHDL